MVVAVRHWSFVVMVVTVVVAVVRRIGVVVVRGMVVVVARQSMCSGSVRVVPFVPRSVRLAVAFAVPRRVEWMAVAPGATSCHRVSTIITSVTALPAFRGAPTSQWHGANAGVFFEGRYL